MAAAFPLASTHAYRYYSCSQATRQQPKVMGGQASIGVGVGFARNTTSAEIRLSQLNTQFDVSDSVSGVTDLYPIASVAWNKGVHNWMTYVTGDIPIGSYDSTRLANVGIGHAAMDAGGAYTYFNPTTGVEFSAMLGATYNWENSDTAYKNGVDSHVDWSASQFVSEQWQLGIALRVYHRREAGVRELSRLQRVLGRAPDRRLRPLHHGGDSTGWMNPSISGQI